MSPAAVVCSIRSYSQFRTSETVGPFVRMIHLGNVLLFSSHRHVVQTTRTISEVRSFYRVLYKFYKKLNIKNKI
jgi:hypothetical protein